MHEMSLERGAEQNLYNFCYRYKMETIVAKDVETMFFLDNRKICINPSLCFQKKLQPRWP